MVFYVVRSRLLYTLGALLAIAVCKVKLLSRLKKNTESLTLLTCKSASLTLQTRLQNCCNYKRRYGTDCGDSACSWIIAGHLTEDPKSMADWIIVGSGL